MSRGDGFEVPTTPLATGRAGRPWRAVLVLAIGLAGAILIARLPLDGDRGRAIATVGPTAAETMAVADVEPVPTPLPLVQWFTGSEAPLDDVLLAAGQVRRLRLASASLIDASLGQPGRDLVLTAPRGGTTCLCWEASGTESGDPRRLFVVRLDRNGRETSRATITSVDGLDLVQRRDGPTYVALEPSPDGRFAYLARVVRLSTKWRVGLDIIDVEAEAVVRTLELVGRSQADHSAVRAVEPPQLRVAPDGRHLLLTTAVERELGRSPRAWIVDLDGAHAGPVVDADGLVASPPDLCDWIDFVTSAIVAQGCQSPISDGHPTMEIRRYDLGAADLGSLVVDPSPQAGDASLIDATRGILYLWDPDGHHLRVANLVNGVQFEADTAAAERTSPASVIVTGPRPQTEGGAAAEAWSDGRSATEVPGDRTLVGSPDGRLLFAIGVGKDAVGTSGVWVFDTWSMTLIERWPALAAYTSIALLEDGRWLAALGHGGETPSGNLADWGTSLTIHDTRDGRAILRIGDLHTDSRVSFTWTEPPGRTE